VRDQAFKAMQVFMGKLEAAAAAMVSTTGAMQQHV
jgi:hypothetical protein